jgi:folate-binding protein YgfZ
MNQTLDGYRLLREKAAVVPVGRDFVRVAGPDALSYLQGQCSQDVVALDPGRSADALLLEPQGRVDAFVRVTRLSDDELILDTDAGFGASVIERLDRFKLRVKLEISVLRWGCVAVRGPQAADLVTSPNDLRVGVEWPGVTGFDLLGEDPTVPGGIEPSGAGAWEAVRIESGIPVMGAEIDERTIPEEAGLVERSVSFTKGCFTGQELVARIDSRGNNVPRRLRGVVGPPGVSPEALAPGTELLDVSGASKSVGRVTSSAWSDGLGATVGLAYVHRSVEIPSELAAGDVSVLVRQLPLVG